jgi:hypothetical protein
MNNKLKLIGIFLIMAAALTCSYIKGGFDGRSGKEFSIISAAEAKKVWMEYPGGQKFDTFNAKIGIDDQGNFKLLNVPNFKTVIKLPANITIEEMKAVNIGMAKIQKSPGRWCPFNETVIWCP